MSDILSDGIPFVRLENLLIFTFVCLSHMNSTA